MKYLFLLLLSLPLIAVAETITFSCNYPSYSDEEGNHKVKEKFELNFIVDIESGKSYMMGNNGSTEVTLLPSDEQFAFIEITSAGNMMTTAIDNELDSVHSRNSVMFGKLLPSQYYGKCEKK
jgi:hypothetical protein